MSADSIIEEMRDMTIDERRALIVRVYDDLGAQSFPWKADKAGMVFSQIKSLNEPQQWEMIARLEHDKGDSSGELSQPLIWLQAAMAHYTDVSEFDADDLSIDQVGESDTQMDQPAPDDWRTALAGDVTEMIFNLWGCVDVTVAFRPFDLWQFLHKCLIARDKDTLVFRIFEGDAIEHPQATGVRRVVEDSMAFYQVPDGVPLDGDLTPYDVVTIAAQSDVPEELNERIKNGAGVLLPVLLYNLRHRLPRLFTSTYRAALHHCIRGPEVTAGQREDYERVSLHPFYFKGGYGREKPDPQFAPLVDKMAGLWGRAGEIKDEHPKEAGNSQAKALIRELFIEYGNVGDLLDSLIDALYNPRASNRTPKELALRLAHRQLYGVDRAIRTLWIRYNASLGVQPGFVQSDYKAH